MDIIIFTDLVNLDRNDQKHSRGFTLKFYGLLGLQMEKILFTVFFLPQYTVAVIVWFVLKMQLILYVTEQTRPSAWGTARSTKPSIDPRRPSGMSRLANNEQSHQSIAGASRGSLSQQSIKPSMVTGASFDTAPEDDEDYLSANDCV